MKVIGAVGDIGSGKDEVLKYLRDRYGVPYLSTGDIVRRMAQEDGVEAPGRTWRPSQNAASPRWAGAVSCAWRRRRS